MKFCTPSFRNIVTPCNTFKVIRLYWCVFLKLVCCSLKFHFFLKCTRVFYKQNIFNLNCLISLTILLGRLNNVVLRKLANPLTHFSLCSSCLTRNCFLFLLHCSVLNNSFCVYCNTCSFIQILITITLNTLTFVPNKSCIILLFRFSAWFSCTCKHFFVFYECICVITVFVSKICVWLAWANWNSLIFFAVLIVVVNVTIARTSKTNNTQLILN